MITLTTTIDKWREANWIKGIINNKYKFCAKVFEEPSHYGINNGKISKLQINTNLNTWEWGFDNCVLNYDRGWDIKPQDKDTQAALDELIKFWDDLGWKFYEEENKSYKNN